MVTFVYSLCAVLGGTVLVCQFVMTLIGLGGHGDGMDLSDDVDLAFDHGGDAGHGHDTASDHDTDHQHHGSSWFFGVLTFRTAVAALAFFGLAGLAAGSAGWPAHWTFAIALAAGTAAMYGVHWLMQGLIRLRADGTVRIERAVGHTASVYLRIPGQKAGAGKIHVNLQDRTMEYEAVTAGGPLPSGAQVRVVGVVGPDLVEVEPAAEAVEITQVERNSHV